MLARLAPVPWVALATLLQPQAAGAVAVVSGLAALLALAAPNGPGPFAVLATQVAGWAVGYGVAGTPAPGRLAAFAAAVYLASVGYALAASVPLAAEVAPEVLACWARRSVPGVAVAVTAGLLAAVPGRLSGSLPLDVVGIAGVLGCALALARLVRDRG